MGLGNAAFLILCFVFSVICTVDLNIHQLQFVADHLEMKECRKLVAALHQGTFELKKESDDSDEPKQLCLGLLLQWDRAGGSGKSFDDLAFRLGQIGRSDLSKILSKSVYEEKAEELDRLFLKDPFKKTVPKDSALLDEKKRRKRKSSNKEMGEELRTWEIAGMVGGALIALYVVCYIIYYVFGNMIVNLFRTYAPQFLVKWVSLIFGECAWFCKKTKQNYYKQVVGRRSENNRGQKSLTELNKSLNCYLNDDSFHASDYFDYLVGSTSIPMNNDCDTCIVLMDL